MKTKKRVIIKQAVVDVRKVKAEFLKSGRSKASLILDLPFSELPFDKEIKVSNLSTFKSAVKEGRGGNFSYIGSNTRKAIVEKFASKKISVRVVKGKLSEGNENLCYSFSVTKR